MNYDREIRSRHTCGCTFSLLLCECQARNTANDLRCKQRNTQTPLRHWQEGQYSERKVSEMTNYSFVLDARGKPLSPTKEVKAWYMIRKGKARLVSKYPMVIRLNRIIPSEKVCKDEIRCGIDDGGLHTGIALVQRCQTKNKVLFKGIVEQRNDVKHLMDVRRGYRRYHRYHKRHRPARFDNRSASHRKGRIAPSILQKRQAAIRVIQRLNQWIHITNYWLEDVAICITNLKPDTTNVREWIIKPMRRQSKAKTESVLGIRHRDLVEYTYRNGETHRGYVTALYPE